MMASSLVSLMARSHCPVASSTCTPTQSVNIAAMSSLPTVRGTSRIISPEDSSNLECAQEPSIGHGFAVRAGEPFRDVWRSSRRMLKSSGTHCSGCQPSDGGFHLMNRVADDTNPWPTLTDLAFHILIALGNGPAHGYAIGKDVEEQSRGRLDPTTGTLYQSLHRLKEEGLIASVEPPERSDERRKRKGPEWFASIAG
jgi:hypothetical protein